MKRIHQLCILSFMLVTQLAFSSSGPLFEVVGTGNPGNVNITLCLNGPGPFSCQQFDVSNLNFDVRTLVPNHAYPAAGIKINTPGYELTRVSETCTPINNGYCVFSVNNNAPIAMSMRNSSSPPVLLYASTGAGSNTNPNSLYSMDSSTGFGTFIMNLTDSDGAVIASDSNYIYHWTGFDPLETFEYVDLNNLTLTNVPFQGDTISEVYGAVFSKTAFVVTTIENKLFRFTPDGDVTEVATTTPYLRGLACYNHKFYAVTPDRNDLYQFNPTTGDILSTKSITMDGVTVDKGLSITANPETGQLYALLKIVGSSTRKLATINPETGVATLIGDATDDTGDAKFSSLTFHPINPDC